MECVVKRRPANLWYRDTLAKLYEELRDYTLVIECYQSMLTIDPNNNIIKRKLLEVRTKLDK
jgi:tetratricopeptide (TPR) repeat protein